MPQVPWAPKANVERVEEEPMDMDGPCSWAGKKGGDVVTNAT